MTVTICEGDGYKILDIYVLSTADAGQNIHLKLEEKTDKIDLDWISDILTLHEGDVTEYKDNL